MKRFLITSMAVAITTMSVSAQKSDKTAKNAPASEPVIMTINKKPVYVSEFSYVYGKNNTNNEAAYTSASINDYVKLYTNFKLMVSQAEEMGLDTSAAFKSELAGYKKQLAKPYLTEKNVTEALIKEAYERMKEEVNASHILVKVGIDAEPEDTLKAFKKITDIRAKAAAGEDFGKLARQFSEDPSAESNNGNLGYFTALQMIYPFETVAYTTPVGQISQPVRTKYGYHVVKVNNKRASQGEVKVAHIMLRYYAGMDTEDSVAASQKIKEIHTKLKNGADWEALCKEFSEDNSSNTKAGELPMFGTNKMVPAFEEAAFGLKKPNQISEPVFSPYGWHIIKLIEKKPLGSFTENETSIKSRVSKDSRSELNRMALIARLKKENNFKENAKNLQKALTKADSTLQDGKWAYKSSDKDLSKVLFNIGTKNFTIEDFFNYVQNNQRTRKGVSAKHIMNLAYKQYVEESLLNFEEAQLETKYNEFKLLVKEYKEGIMLFQLKDERVWSKASSDTTGLKTFFNNNRDKYKWDTRADVTLYSAANKDIMAKTMELVKSTSQNGKGRYPVKDIKTENIYFDATQTAVKAEDSKKINDLVNQLNSDPNLSVEITAYTGNKTTGAANLQLSNKRAKMIADSLKKKGIAETRISMKAYGAAMTSVNANNKGNNNVVAFALYSSSNKALEKLMNESNALNLQITEKKYQKGENAIVDACKMEKGEYDVEKDGRVYKVIIKNIEAPTQKALDETRGLVTSDYQNYLEQEWIKELKQKYTVEINDAEVKKLVKK